MDLNFQPIDVPNTHGDYRRAVNEAFGKMAELINQLRAEIKQLKTKIEALERGNIDLSTMTFEADHDGAWLSFSDNNQTPYKIDLPMSGLGSSGIIDGADGIELVEVREEAIRDISIEQTPDSLTLILHQESKQKRVPFPTAGMSTTGVLVAGASPADAV